VSSHCQKWCARQGLLTLPTNFPGPQFRWLRVSSSGLFGTQKRDAGHLSSTNKAQNKSSIQMRAFTKAFSLLSMDEEELQRTMESTWSIQPVHVYLAYDSTLATRWRPPHALSRTVIGSSAPIYIGAILPSYCTDLLPSNSLRGSFPR